MIVLVTGATGFIGNHVVRKLLQMGHVVTASSLHPEKAAASSWYPLVNYRPFNISDPPKGENYFSYFGRPDRIVHLAWQGLPDYRAPAHVERHLFSHYDFLKNLASNGASDITVAGTCLEYGLQEGRLSETMAAIPVNSYSMAKDRLRQLMEQLQLQTPFRLKWARLFYMYGEGQPPHALLQQLERALLNGETEFRMSKGDQQRDYLPVEKMADYLIQIAMQEKVSGIINCCSGVPVTVCQLVEDHLRKRKKTIRLVKGFYSHPDYEPFKFWGDDTKLRSILHP